jgi:hypothetical protein
MKKKKRKMSREDGRMESKDIEDFHRHPDENYNAAIMGGVEDEYFSKIGEDRLQTFDKAEALTDEEVWGKSRAPKGRGNKK